MDSMQIEMDFSQNVSVLDDLMEGIHTESTEEDVDAEEDLHLLHLHSFESRHSGFLKQHSQRSR